MSNNCTLLINTCDKYEDAWDPYFILLKKYWAEVNDICDIVLNTESKSYKNEDFDIKTFNLYGPDENPPWGQRMIDTVDKIQTEYILTSLEDLFLEDYVDHERFKQCLEWIKNDSDAFNFAFLPLKNAPLDISSKYHGFNIRYQKADYKYTCQMSLWRKEDLKRAFKKFESPWQWEVNGNLRSHKIKRKFYVANKDEELIFPYAIDGWSSIFKGKWYLPTVKRIFDNNNINMDYDRLGYCDESIFKEYEENAARDKENLSLFRKFTWPLYLFKLWLLKQYSRIG